MSSANNSTTARRRALPAPPPLRRRGDPGDQSTSSVGEAPRLPPLPLKPVERRASQKTPYGGGGLGRGLAALLAVLVAALFVALPAHAEEKLPVVASFSIIGDIAKNIGGDRVAVSTIVGPDGDAHVYQPNAADGRRVAEAKLVLANGLGFEGWLERLLKNSRGNRIIVVLGNNIASQKTDEGLDPHAWQSAANAVIYAGAIRDALIAADPPNAATYKGNADAYIAKLKALDAEIEKAFTNIPKERRRVVSTHDAFGYFSARYGVEFIAPQGVSTDAEPNARDIARIIDEVKKQKVGAVFLENIADPRLARRIAAETGAKIGGTLYSDALSGPKEDGATYIDMMRHNVRELAKALAP